MINHVFPVLRSIQWPPPRSNKSQRRKFKSSPIDEWIKKMYTCTQFNYKKGILAIYKKMDGPWDHNAKWNKSDRERQILHDLTHRIWKKLNSETEQMSGCQRLGMRGNGWRWSKNRNFQLQVSLRDIMMIIVNNTVLSTWKLLREWS